MFSRKFFALLLVCFLAFTAAGCRLLSPGGDDGASAATVTIKTLIKKPAAATANILGNLKAGIRPAITEEIVTGATVTLTLSDGRKIIMTDNGNGEYTATVTGLEGMEGFIIEARKGDLLVQNMVTDLKNTDLSNIESNHLTTAFAQVALAAAKVLATSTGIQVASLEDLIKQVSSIEIEFNELKRQVTDENNVTYEKSRKYVAIGLGEADENAELPGAGEKSLLERLIAGENPADFAEILQEQGLTTWAEEITKAIEDGDVSLPTVAPAEDKDKINAAMDIFLNAFLKVQTGTALSQIESASLSAVLDEDFVLRGMKKTHILNSTPNGKEDLDRFVGEQVLTKVTDNMYLVNVRGTAFFKDGNSQTIDSTVDGYSFNPVKPDTFTSRSLWVQMSEFPVIVRKHTDGSWKVWGNRTKIDDVSIDLQFVIDLLNNNQKRTQLWLKVEDTAAFPVTNITVSGGAIGETPVVLTKNGNLADANSWYYWFTDANGTRNSPYPATGWPYSSTQHFGGQVYKFVITFEDNSTQTYYHYVPEIPAGYAPFNADQVSVTVGEDKVSLTWPQNPFPGFEDYYVNVWHMSQDGDGRVLETNITNVTTKSLDIPFTTSSYTLKPGNQYSINFHSFLKSGINQHFHKMITIPQTVDPTIQSAVGIVQAIDSGTAAIGQGSLSINAPIFPSAMGSSLRAGVAITDQLPFPTGTEYFQAYTAYTAMGSLTNIFKLPNPANSGIAHQLLQLLTTTDNTGVAITYDETNNPGPMFLSAIPGGFKILVVFQSLVNGLGIDMQLYNDAHWLLNDPNDFSMAFKMEGKITAGDYEIIVNEGMADVAKRGQGTPVTVKGTINSASLKNGSTQFAVDVNGVNKTATLVNVEFDHTGIINGKTDANSNFIAPAEIRVDFTGFTAGTPDGTVVATVAYKNNVLTLTIKGQGGDPDQDIPIQQ